MNLAKLSALNEQLRLAIRKWLLLPADTATVYFYTSYDRSGLSIPSFITTSLGLIRLHLKSFKSLETSSSPVIREIT